MNRVCWHRPICTGLRGLCRHVVRLRVSDAGNVVLTTPLIFDYTMPPEMRTRRQRDDVVFDTRGMGDRRTRKAAAMVELRRLLEAGARQQGLVPLYLAGTRRFPLMFVDVEGRAQ